MGVLGPEAGVMYMSCMEISNMTVIRKKKELEDEDITVYSSNTCINFAG
jgi:hypothetical protein